MPNHYQNVDKIREIYEKARQRSVADRYAYERDWFRNILFYIGIQWIVYSVQAKKWLPRTLKKWVPRPVTNKFASHANTIWQILAAKAPQTTARAGTDSAEDMATADAANRFLDVILNEAEADEARQLMTSWIVFTGNAFLHPCYDPDPRYGMSEIPHLTCVDCAITGKPQAFPADEAVAGCPACGSQNLAPALDEEGAAIVEEAPRGKMKLEVFSPFEIFLDLEAQSMAEVQEILVRRRYPVDVVRGKWPRPAGDEIQPDSPTGGPERGGGVNYLRAIAYAAAGREMLMSSGGGASADNDLGVTVDFLWKRPCEDFPEGLVAIFAGDKHLNPEEEDLRLPYRKRDGTPLWPWHLIRFQRVPGRLLGRTRLDDIAPKQEQRNKLESMIQLIITRSANPVWLKARNTGVDVITGEPGQEIEGNWQHDPRLKPERIPGENVPTSVIAWLEKIDADMEELAGTFDVLRGNAPQGISAGTALRLLLERAVTSFTPILEEIERVWGDVVGDLLTIFQQFGTDERKAQIQGPGKTWEVQNFNNADVSGNVDIVVEAGSAAPKSSVGQQALLQDLSSMMVINPQEPETQYKILEEFGATSLLGSVDLNIKQAERENWRFLRGIPPEINPIIDNHIVHLQVHRQYALSSDFEALDPEMQNVWLTHILEHQTAMVPTAPAEGEGEEKPADEGGESAPAKPNGGAGDPLPAGMTPQSEGPDTPEGMPGLPPSSLTPMDTAMPPMFPGAL